MNVNDQLIHALINRDIPNVIRLINEGADVNYYSVGNNFGIGTPLSFCFRNDTLSLIDYEILDILISHGAHFSDRMYIDYFIIYKLLSSNSLEALYYFYSKFSDTFLEIITGYFSNHVSFYYVLDDLYYNNIKWILDHIQFKKEVVSKIVVRILQACQLKLFSLFAQYYPYVLDIDLNKKTCRRIREYIDDVKNKTTMLALSNRKKYNKDIIRHLYTNYYGKSKKKSNKKKN